MNTVILIKKTFIFTLKRESETDEGGQNTLPLINRNPRYLHSAINNNRYSYLCMYVQTKSDAPLRG